MSTLNFLLHGPLAESEVKVGFIDRLVDCPGRQKEVDTENGSKNGCILRSKQMA